MTEEEASTSPLKHILTRNLGSSEETDPEIFELLPSQNDRYILCSDGLTDLVADEEILRMGQEADGPDQLCRSLLELVLSRGAHDNTTIASVFIDERKKARKRSLNRFGLITACLFGGIRRIVKK